MSRRVLNKKENSFYNGLCVQHARSFGKKLGARNRRRAIKQQIKKEQIAF